MGRKTDRGMRRGDFSDTERPGGTRVIKKRVCERGGKRGERENAVGGGRGRKKRRTIWKAHRRPNRNRYRIIIFRGGGGAAYKDIRTKNGQISRNIFMGRHKR